MGNDRPGAPLLVILSGARDSQANPLVQSKDLYRWVTTLLHTAGLSISRNRSQSDRLRFTRDDKAANIPKSVAWPMRFPAGTASPTGLPFAA